MKEGLDVFFSIPIKAKKQKSSRFQKLYNYGLEIGLLLEKSLSKYIIDDNKGGEWVCGNLNEVESILNSQKRRVK